MSKSTDSLSPVVVSRRVVSCKPSVAFGNPMQNYIQAQVKHPRKQWVYEILNGKSESENVKFRNDDIVILPDIDMSSTDNCMHWLAIFTDRSLRTLRDLRGKHLPLLKRVRDTCKECVANELNCDEHNVLMYLHYLPSVFQMHMHIVAPYTSNGKGTTRDVCKIHPIDNIISNLELDSNYYKKIDITTVLVGSEVVSQACTLSVPVQNSKRAHLKL